MKLQHRIAVTLGLSLCLTIAAHAQHWPAFRGPNGSGIDNARPLPVTWDGEKSVNILWKTPVPGLGHSSPAIWGERIFLTSAISSAATTHHNPKDDGIDPSTDASIHQWQVHSVDKRSGKILWTRTAHQGVPKVKRHVKATQANATPVTNGRIVIAAFGSEGLYAYNMDGKLLWKQDLGILDPGYAGQPDLSWGFASSPIIYENLVILQCDRQKDSFIVAFHIADGSRAWLTQRDDIPAWSTPVIYKGKTRTEMVTSGSLFYRGYDPLTGKELWRLKDDSQVKVPSPVVAHDLFYLSGGNPRGREFYVTRPGASGDISPPVGETPTRQVAWRKSRGSSYTPTPIVYGDYLYICNDNGVLTVYHALSGSQIYQNRIGTTNSTFTVFTRKVNAAAGGDR